MNKLKLLVVLTTMLLLNGCIKEALLMNDLKGEWSLSSDNYLVTTSEDVSFLDLYSKPWEGTVTINGVQQEYGNNRLISDESSYFCINYDIYLFFWGSSPKLSYKRKMYDSPVSWDVIKTGIIDKTIIIQEENTTTTIKIDLRAPTTFLAKGVEYPIRDPRWRQGIFFEEINFISPIKIAGNIIIGDIGYTFRGSWSANSSEITFKIRSEISDEKITESFRYINSHHELILYRSVDFSKTDFPGVVPSDKVARVNRVLKYERKN